MITGIKLQCMELIKASNNDMEFLRKLRNSISGVCTYRHRITRKEHLGWWTKAKWQGIKIYIIWLDKKRIGYIRVNTHYFNEISIAFKEDYRRKGYGARALSLLPSASYIAVINVNNRSSLNFFKKNKFTVIDHCYILKR